MILYLLPVLLVVWFSDGVSIAIVSVFCTLTMFAANVMSEGIYAHTFPCGISRRSLVFSRVRVLAGIHSKKLVRMRRGRLTRAGIPGSCAGK